MLVMQLVPTRDYQKIILILRLKQPWLISKIGYMNMNLKSQRLSRWSTINHYHWFGTVNPLPPKINIEPKNGWLVQMIPSFFRGPVFSGFQPLNVWMSKLQQLYIKQDSFHYWFVCFFFQKAMVNLHWPLLGLMIYIRTYIYIWLHNTSHMFVKLYFDMFVRWTCVNFLLYGPWNETPPRKPLKRVRRIRRRWDSPPRNQKRKSFVKPKKEEISLSLYYLRCEFPRRNNNGRSKGDFSSTTVEWYQPM